MTTRVQPHQISLRSVTPADDAFLRGLYAATRQAELAQIGWDDAQVAAFLRLQFDAQHRHYLERFPLATFDVVEVDGRAAGRLYVARGPAEIRVVDIALLPEVRGLGAGTLLVEALITESMAVGVPIVLHVERGSRAVFWYLRMGFTQIEDRGVHLFLLRQPAGKQ